MMMKYLAVGDVDSAICILSAAGEHDLSYAVIDSFSYTCETYIKTKSGSVYVTVTHMHSKLKGVTRYQYSQTVQLIYSDQRIYALIIYFNIIHRYRFAWIITVTSA